MATATTELNLIDLSEDAIRVIKDYANQYADELPKVTSVFGVDITELLNTLREDNLDPLKVINMVAKIWWDMTWGYGMFRIIILICNVLSIAFFVCLGYYMVYKPMTKKMHRATVIYKK